MSEVAHQASSPEPWFPKEPPLGLREVTDELIFTSSAREAWRLLLSWRAKAGRGKVLLPAYIGYTEREGSGVFDPVRASGLAFDFYPVDARLGTSVETLRAMLAGRDVGVLLVVHWFGRPHVDLPEVRALCDEFGVLLVEDCAHVLEPLAGPAALGRLGDAAFYSLHKTFGGEAGGVLRWNRRPAGALGVETPSSCPAAVLESVLRADAVRIATHRRQLYQDYLSHLRDVPGLQVMYPELGSYIPQTFPVLVADGLRERLYFALGAHGVPLTALYYRLIPELTAASHPTSHAIAGAILNLPVHQGVPAALVPRVAALLRSTLAELRA